eukprot:m.176446 g.176446  ORF g.176446 m.176446 type:complete len:371 (-) comp16799_c0_seq1:81-1193(-)
MAVAMPIPARPRLLIFLAAALLCSVAFWRLQQPSLCAVLATCSHSTVQSQQKLRSHLPSWSSYPTNTVTCRQSSLDSYGYICDSNEAWQLRKTTLKHQAATVVLTSAASQSCAAYFQINFEPSLSCSSEQRLGPAGDGGKWVCDPHRIPQLYANRSEACIIMSIGSNNDFGFEESMHAAFGSLCDIHTFDHTVENPNPPNYVTYHDVGIAQEDGVKVRSLPALMGLAMMNHSLGYVEVLKIDVEGHEFESLTQLLIEDDKLDWPRQVLIEIHNFDVEVGPWDDPYYKQARPTDNLREIHQLLAAFQYRGYAVFHKEANIQFSFRSSQYCAIEFSLLRLNLTLPPVPDLLTVSPVTYPSNLMATTSDRGWG